jgi:N-terminal domain of argonaute/Argonaute linker 1 domain
MESTMNLEFPERPGYGNHGDPVKLITTYFELIAGDNISFYRYFVDVDARYRIASNVMITLLLREHFSSYLRGIATDHASILISSQRLPIREGPYIIDCAKAGDLRSTEERTCEIKLRLTGVIRKTDIVENLAQNGACSKRDMIQALNIIVGFYARSSPRVFSSSLKRFFDADSDNVPLGSGLYAVRGLTLSIRNVSAPRLLVNVHTTHGVFYEAGNLAHFMVEHLKQHGANLEKLGLVLKMVKIETIHGTRRVGSITDFASPSDGGDLKESLHVSSYGANAAEVLFFWNRADRQEYISVRDYFHQCECNQSKQ